MGFHGVVSRGCEKCRKRRVKCDLQRPGCVRCSKIAEACPGYRDLGEVLFRNENRRIIGKKGGESPPSSTPPSQKSTRSSPETIDNGFVAIPSILGHQTHDLGHEFFFARYISPGTPFSREYHDWMKQQCAIKNNAVADAVNAVGLAGLANVSSAPQIKIQAMNAYERANKELTNMLQHPKQRLTDETLLVVIMLSLYQIVSFESWHSCSIWAQFVDKALELVDQRGKEQFDTNRGGQLYMQIRTPVLCICTQQHHEVPPALMNATYIFENAELRQRWRDSDDASPASMSVISFRLVNLRSAVKTRRIADPSEIQTLAVAVDRDLMAWKSTLPRHWRCFTPVSSSEDENFDKKQHHYPTTWLAEIWNTWRVLRIACYQIISESGQTVETAVQVIRQMSEEICCSVSTFYNNPRAMSLVRHLSVVGLQACNTLTTRKFAAQELRSVGVRMGIQHATGLADLILDHLQDNTNTGGFARLDCDTVPLAAPF